MTNQEIEARLAIGTCAWSREDWRGVFYPEHLPASQRLAFYARHFSAVEVDSTFYHAPAREVTAHWAASTPDDFIFSCKMPREITHERKLRDCAGALEEFLDGLAPLREKLACVVVQLPPFFTLKKDEAALRDFVRALPGDFRFAVEFRDADWHLPRIAHLLEEHRVCWVWNDLTPVERQAEGAFEFLPDTADFLYVRLLGDLEKKFDATGERLHRYRELMWPRDAAVENWAVRLGQQKFTHRLAFVAANDHYEGFAPRTCQRLAARLGVEILLPKSEELSAGADAADDAQLKLL